MPTFSERDRLAGEFDAIAALEDGGHNHNAVYHRFMLRQLPQRVDSLLDVGCGKGEFAALVRGRARRVVGIDLSLGMLRAGTGGLGGEAGFVRADLLAAPFAPESFDAIVSVATLHHVPLGEALGALARLLRPGGRLVVVDLFKLSRTRGILTAPFAFGLSAALRMLHTGHARPSRAVREVWEAHGKHDVYPLLDEVKAVARVVLPGATVRAHLLWRYSLVWTKNSGGSD